MVEHPMNWDEATEQWRLNEAAKRKTVADKVYGVIEHKIYEIIR